MKKVLFITALAMALLAVSCEKEKFDPTKPSITWETNSGFSQVEMTDALDATVTVAAQGKIQDLKLVFNLGGDNNLLNQYIKIESNKSKGGSNPVLDLVDDASAANLLGGLGMRVGSSLRGREEMKLDLRKILERILLGQPVANNSIFTIEVRVTDQADNTVSKTAKFHFTSAPSISWAKNQTFADVDLDAAAIDCKVTVWAPGKIDKLTIKLEDAADKSVTDKVKNRTTSGTTLMDLVNDEKVSQSIKTLPAPSAISGKDQVTLDFSFVYDWAPDMTGASLNVFTITVTDKNAKETVQQVRFKKN
jgi:hypothetical protein